MRSTLVGLHLYNGNKDYVYIWGDIEQAHSPELRTTIQLINAVEVINLVLITTVTTITMRYA